LNNFYKNFDENTAQEIYAGLMQIYYEDLESYRPHVLEQMHKKYKGDFLAFTKKEMVSSKLSSKTALEQFLKSPDLKTFDKVRTRCIKFLLPFIKHMEKQGILRQNNCSIRACDFM
jgi:hypothetical protein